MKQFKKSNQQKFIPNMIKLLKALMKELKNYHLQ